MEIILTENIHNTSFQQFRRFEHVKKTNTYGSLNNDIAWVATFLTILIWWVDALEVEALYEATCLIEELHASWRRCKEQVKLGLWDCYDKLRINTLLIQRILQYNSTKLSTLYIQYRIKHYYSRMLKNLMREELLKVLIHWTFLECA